MKGGVLYRREDEPACKIGGSLCGSRRIICQGNTQYQAWVRPLESAEEGTSGREYCLQAPQGQLVMRAVPHYRPGEDPAQAGWPLNRTPVVDRADLVWQKRHYSLEMVSCENYLLKNARGDVALCVMHRGVSGGWRMECSPEFQPWAICAVFVFCRYLEQENQMITV